MAQLYGFRAMSIQFISIWPEKWALNRFYSLHYLSRNYLTREMEVAENTCS